MITTPATSDTPPPETSVTTPETATPEKTGPAVTEPPPPPPDIAAEYKAVSGDFVSTVAGIISAADVALSGDEISGLEEIITLIDRARNAVDDNDLSVLETFPEISERLLVFRKRLGIEAVDFSGLCIPAPERVEGKYVIASGIWLRETRLALQDLPRHKEDGVNAVLVPVPLDCDADLNFSTPPREAIAAYVQAAHASGMAVFLTLCQGPPAGYSRGWHAAYFGEKKEVSGADVFAALTPFVLDWAEFAEEYGVEVFMPVVEPIMWASMDTAYWEMDDAPAAEVCGVTTAWMQSILPGIRELYSGRLMFATHNRVGADSSYFELDFSGYDFIADWEAGADLVADISGACASFNSCLGVIHHITLYVGGLDFEPAHTLTEEEQAIAYDDFFRLTWNEINSAGIMLDLGVGKEYFGRPAEQVIESWLAETNKVPPASIDTLWRTRGLFELLDAILSPSETIYSDEWLNPPGHH